MRLLFSLLLILCTSTIYAQSDSPKKLWYEALPSCPCRNPDWNSVQLNDGWAKDKGDLSKYHRGAIASYRSYPAVKTSAGNSCQQCCYDRNGDLITSGRGAGTPDKKSSCSGEDKTGVMKIRFFGLIGHYFADVKPWNKLMKQDSLNGWKIYNRLWLPNNGFDCKVNIR